MKRFKRTNSTSESYHTPKKQSKHLQQVNHLSRSTIIPFVNDRFEVIPKNANICVPGKGFFITSQSKQLACSIVMYRLAKMVRLIVGKKLIGYLKIVSYQQKILVILQQKMNENKMKCFKILLKVGKNKRVNKQKLFALYFLLTKLYQRCIFRGLCKILTVEETTNIMKNSVQTSSPDTQKNHFKSQQNILQSGTPEITMRPTISMKSMISPPQLKTDQIDPFMERIQFWSIHTSKYFFSK